MTDTKVKFGYIGFVDEKEVTSLLSFICLNVLLVFSSSFFNYALEFDTHYNKTRDLYWKYLKEEEKIKWIFIRSIVRWTSFMFFNGFAVAFCILNPSVFLILPLTITLTIGFLL